MSVSVGEAGRPIRLSTGGYDMSSSTALTLILTRPDGTQLTKTEASSNAVTAPAVALTAVTDPDIGPQSASTYFEFTCIAGDFDVPGDWTICGIFENSGSGIIYHTVPPAATLPVLEACS